MKPTIHVGIETKSNKHVVTNYIICTCTYFFYKEDLLTYKMLQKYATKYIHMYNMKYNEMAA